MILQKFSHPWTDTNYQEFHEFNTLHPYIFYEHQYFVKKELTKISDSIDIVVPIEKDFELIGKSPGDIHVGQSINAAVRPEKIGLRNQPASEYPNCYPAEVLEAVFLGSLTRYQVSFKENGSRAD